MTLCWNTLLKREKKSCSDAVKKFLDNSVIGLLPLTTKDRWGNIKDNNNLNINYKTKYSCQTIVSGFSITQYSCT